MKPLILSFLLMFLAFQPALAQLDLKEKAQLVGIQTEEKQGASAEEKITDISFIFVDKPSTYIHGLEGDKLTMEFYDAVMGDQPIDKVEGGPFTDVKVSSEKIDVNKIEGMSPDLKDVVKVVFALKEGVQMDYTATDDFNVITVSTAWTLGGKLVTTQTAQKSRTWLWIVSGVVGVGAGAIGYLVLGPGGEDKPKKIEDPEWNPALPSLPSNP